MTDIRHILADESDDDVTGRPEYRTPDSHESRGLPSPILPPDDRPGGLMRSGPGPGAGRGATAAIAAIAGAVSGGPVTKTATGGTVGGGVIVGSGTVGGGYVVTDKPPPLALWAIRGDTPPPRAVTPPQPWSLTPSHPSGTKRSGSSDTSAQASKRRKEDEVEPVMPPTPPMPPFLTQPPEICKHAPLSNIVGDRAKFSWGMKVITLTNTSTLQIWTDQIESIARESGCLEELTTRFTTFPSTGTVDALVCKARFSSCWTVLRETISGPVWAYMRVLGYRKIPVFKGPDGFQWQPTPADCFYFAREACKRMDTPGTPAQGRQEVMIMVEEAQAATPADYNNQRQFTKGKDWLLAILNKMVRDGDREVCEALYETKPPWAPEWPPTPVHTHPSPVVGPLQPQQQPMRTSSTPEWSPAPSLPRLGSLTPPRPPHSALFSLPRPLASPTFPAPVMIAPSPVLAAAQPRPNSAPGRELHAMQTHPRSNSIAEFSPVPSSPILGSGTLLPPIQPRPESNVPAESPPTPTQQHTSGSAGDAVPPPNFPNFHSTLEWSTSLTQEKMRNATWKQLNVKVPTVRTLAVRETSADASPSRRSEDWDRMGSLVSAQPSLERELASSHPPASRLTNESAATSRRQPPSPSSTEPSKAPEPPTGADPGTGGGDKAKQKKGKKSKGGIDSLTNPTSTRRVMSRG